MTGFFRLHCFVQRLLVNFILYCSIIYFTVSDDDNINSYQVKHNCIRFCCCAIHGAWCVSAMTKKVVGAKIACLDFGLMKAKMKMGVQILLETPEKLDGIRQR